jgi:hypothetical protein
LDDLAGLIDWPPVESRLKGIHAVARRYSAIPGDP